MPSISSQWQRKPAAVLATMLLTGPLAGSADAQSATGANHANAMLVVLKNQPAREIVRSLLSPTVTARKLAETDLRQAAEQGGAAEPTRLHAAQELMTTLVAQTKQAAAEVRAATAAEQEFTAARLIGLGASGIRHYTAINMLQAEIPDLALPTVKQWPEVAELIPVGSHQALLDQIELCVTNPAGVMAPVLTDNDDGFLRLLDRVIDDRDALMAASAGISALNTLPVSEYSIARLSALGTFAHLPVKAMQLNGSDSNYLSDSVSAERPFRFYAGKAQGAFQSTLAWDRHFGEGLQPVLRNLSLALYGLGDGAERATAASQNQSIQQAAIADGGEVVIKVRLQSPQDGAAVDEPFAVAVSEPGFRLAAGPKLSVKCAADCTVGNDGDLPAFDVTARADGVEYKLGAIAAWSSAKFTPRQKVSAASVTSHSFGEVFTANASTGDPCSGQWIVSPQPLRLNPIPSGEMTGLVSVTPPAGCLALWIVGVDPSDPWWLPLNFSDFSYANLPVTTCMGCSTGPASFTVIDYGAAFTEGGDHNWMVDIYPKTSSVIAPTYGSINVVETSRIPAVKLVTPKGGEQYTRGKDTLVVSWTYDAGLPARNSTGTIDLMSGSVAIATIAYSVPLIPPGGTVNYPVPPGLAPGSYSVRILSTIPNIKAQDQSATFTIRADTPPPASISNVTASDGVAGFDNMQMQIGWVVSGTLTGPTTSTIEVLHGDAVVPGGTISGVPLIPSGYSWYIPINTPAANNYKVRITPTDGSIKADESGPHSVVSSWSSKFDDEINKFMFDPTNYQTTNNPPLDQKKIPGGQLGILHNGKLAYVKGYGEATENSLFRIASVTKPFTAAAIYKLIEEGPSLALDSKVFKFKGKGILKGPSDPKNVDARIYDISIQQLLTHRGGWDLTNLADQYKNNGHPNYDLSSFDPMFQTIFIAADLNKPKPIPGPPFENQQANIPNTPPTDDIVDYVLSNFKLKCDPGQAMRYSNFGYAVLGRVIEELKNDFPGYMKSIFKIIGAKNTFFGNTAKQDANGKCLPSPVNSSEVSYHPSPKDDVQWCVLKPHISGPTPDGSFDLTAMEASGGLVSNTSDLLRFEAAMTGTSTQVSQILKNNVAPDKFPSYDGKPIILFPALSTDQGKIDKAWLGDLPGTLAMLIQHDVPADPAQTPKKLAHTGFAVLFNLRPDQKNPPSDPLPCTPPATPSTSPNQDMLGRLQMQLNYLADHSSKEDWPVIPFK